MAPVNLASRHRGDHTMTAVSYLRTRHAWPIALLLLGVALAAAITLTTGAFSSASKPVVAGVPIAAPAGHPVYLSERATTFYGWATVGSGRKYDYYPRLDIQCFAAPCAMPPAPVPTTIPAYRWTGSAWVTTSYAIGERVYVWPFAVDWSWTWTKARGWLAMKDDRIIIDYEYWAVAT